MVHSTILANVGAVAETKHDWAAAEHHHREALRLRREIADARGVLTLTLLVAHHLADRDGDGEPPDFLADLVEQEPAIRDLGPTTTSAIERFRRGGETASSGRVTNGAAMRALPIGWALPHDQAERRRQVTIAMSRATHADPAALVAACVMAACAS